MSVFKKQPANNHESIINSIGEAVFVHHPDSGIIHDVNEPMLKMYGYERSEVIGKTVEGLSAVEDGFTVERAASKIQKAKLGESELFEWKAKRKDGSTFWAEVSLKLAKYQRRMWLIAVVRDISDKKENELKIQRFIDLQKILADLSTKFISLPISEFDVNINKALELLGKTFQSDRAYIFTYSGNHLLMSNTHEWCNMGIIPFKDELQDIPVGLFLWHHNQLIKGKTIKIPDISLLGESAAKEKAEFEKEGIQSILVVPFLHNNQIIGFIGIDYVNQKRSFNNEDENALKAFGNIIGQSLVRKKYEESIKKEKLKAEESDQLKTAFLSNMSHEIRTPMNGILGFSELLTDLSLSKEEQSNYINIINDSGKQLLSIINDIIDISKIESNQIIINNESISIIDEVKSILYLFEPAINEKGLTLDFVYEDKSNTDLIFIDKVKLKQIITNLVDNALKYTNKGGISVSLKLEKEIINLIVSDTGIGIGDEELVNIFNRFWRANNEYTKITSGTGLGLAITKGYIDKMGGTIQVNSQKNKGTEFSVFLPLLKF